MLDTATKAPSPGFSFIPEIASMKVASQTEAEMKSSLLKNAADVMDAQADFLQTLIDRCKAATITHEELVERLTVALQSGRTAARCARKSA